MAAVYRAKVANLRAALASGRDQEALEAARALIDKVVISPPDTEDDPPGIEPVDERSTLLRAAGLASHHSFDQTKPGSDVLDLFASSAKEGRGAKPPPC